VQLTVTLVATGSAGRLGLQILPVRLPMQRFSASLITIKAIER
jgi:hypothetical protein